MVDYTTPTGSGGTMLIRDLGYQIQFHIQAGSSATFVGSLPWSGVVNNTDVGGAFNYPSGAPWVHVASYDIPYTQLVRFSIANSGTSGLGGPTDFYQWIYRSAPPDKVPWVSAVGKHNTADISWGRGAMNGGTFIDDQIQVSSTPQSGTGDFIIDGNLVNYGSTTTATSITQTGLKLGTRYWVHVRHRNDVGWGPWSDIITVDTLFSGRIKVGSNYRSFVGLIKIGGEYREFIPYEKDAGSYKATRE